MKLIVISNFIDNKIRTAISERKTVSEIKEILAQRIENTKKVEKMRSEFREFMIFFAEKRITDIDFMVIKYQSLTNSKVSEMSVPTQRLLNMIRLRDKLVGLTYDQEMYKDA